MGKSDVRRGWFETVICSARRGQDARLRRALEARASSSAGKRDVLHLGCRARMTVNRCFWSKHGTRTKLHGGGSPNKWRKRWVSKTLSSIFCPVRRLLEPSKVQMTIFPRPSRRIRWIMRESTGVLGRCRSASNPTRLAVPVFWLRNAQHHKNAEFPTQRRGLKHQTSRFCSELL